MNPYLFIAAGSLLTMVVGGYVVLPLWITVPLFFLGRVADILITRHGLRKGLEEQNMFTGKCPTTRRMIGHTIIASVLIGLLGGFTDERKAFLVSMILLFPVIWNLYVIRRVR